MWRCRETVNERISDRLNNRIRSEEHTSELQSRFDLVCRLLLEKKKKKICLLYLQPPSPDAVVPVAFAYSSRAAVVALPRRLLEDDSQLRVLIAHVVDRVCLRQM